MHACAHHGALPSPQVDQCYENTSVLVFEMPCEYRTQRVKVDTKEFGLPQTRSRYYMFAWRVDAFPGVPHRDIGEGWVRLVEGLKAPLLYPVSDFLLSDDHDIARRYRDMLQGRPGEQFAMHKGKGDFYSDTTLKQVKGEERGVKSYQPSFDLEVNLGFKQGAGIPKFARPFTHWGPNGVLALRSPYEWTEYIRCLGRRAVDLIDACSVKVAEAHVDALHQMVIWDISQNIHLVASLNRPGTSCCITPGGKNYLSSLGRPMFGYEKLLLQGIPPDKLLLGRETEVQLSDLAGNAMSMPVVSAAVLAALCVGAFCRKLQALEIEPTADDARVLATASTTAAAGGSGAQNGAHKGSGKAKKANKGHQADGAASSSAECSAAAPMKPLLAPAPTARDRNLLEVLRELCADTALLERVVASSVLCACETSGRISADSILKCSECLCSVCCGCTIRFEGSSHALCTPSCPASPAQRPRLPFECEHELRARLPASLRLSLGDLAGELDADVAACLADGLEFRLARLVRARGAWQLWYCAYSEGAGSSLAHLRITLGSISTRRGACALLYSLDKARRKVRGKAEPIARLVLYEGAVAGAWERRADAAELRLELAGSEPTISWRAALELTKLQRERWPGRLEVRAGGAVSSGLSGVGRLVEGTYERQGCKGSCARDVLYRRVEPAPTASRPPTWLLYLPEPNHNGPCQPVISLSPSYIEGASHALLELPPDWLPDHALSTAPSPEVEVAVKRRKTDGDSGEGGGGACAVDALVRAWTATTLSFTVPSETTTVKEGHEATVVCTVGGLSPATASMMISHALHDEPGKLGSGGGGGGGGRAAGAEGVVWLPISLMRVSSSVIERRLAEAIARPLLAWSARGGLERLASWRPLRRATGEPAWGQCPKSTPARPAENWSAEGFRTYDVAESNQFERALRERAHFWESHVHRASGDVRLSANPTVAAHRAAEQLMRHRTHDTRGALTVEWRCLEHAEPPPRSLQGEFTIPSSKDYEPASLCDVLGDVWDATKPLFDRQARPHLHLEP